MGNQTVILACPTLAGELKEAMKEAQSDSVVYFMPPGLHRDPKVLHHYVQDKIDHFYNVSKIVVCTTGCGAVRAEHPTRWAHRPARAQPAARRTTLKKNADWWDKPRGNVDNIVFTPIKAAATRSAALISGQVDMVVDPPVQDLERIKRDANIKVIEGPENRTIFLGFDQHRDELMGSNVKGKNPLKDKRVRQALYQAVDMAAIERNVMRGLGKPTGTMIAPMVHGWTKDLGARAAKYDVEGAKKLLADAGYPNGFELVLDCPNDRYVNDEAICQAVTAMWTRIGVKTKLQTNPMAIHSAKILKFDVSAYMLGWGVATFDALYSLDSLISTVDPKGGAAGNFNNGRMSNPKVDALIQQIKTEMDAKKRDEQIHEALKIVKDDYNYLPLHDQIRPWAMRKSVTTVHRADDRPMPTWTTIK